ncbi:MAG: ABC transporter permease [Eubacterium sp.]|nr:ABC transporter permease [Eubacterium sp.]MCM1216711.1 ABC transporter permease [Lachnospiraceae bacterium]MCM1238759.1 ABC transporter permease [Lachnospiraceae bacterium]MCM1343379.1 ABC transporter permease [Muribaculaceae bacterium]
MRLNPVIKREVRVQSRSMKICWGVFAYELILALVFFLAMMVIQDENQYSTNNIYSMLVWLYPVIAAAQLVILALIVPVRTASAISGEKERQTFDIMMTTSMTPFSIVMGKVLTAIIQSMFFVVASMPIMALSFVVGGVSWSYLFWFIAVAVLMSFFAASIGILCSSICKRSVGAVTMAYGFYLIFFVVTALPSLLGEYVSYTPYSYSGMHYTHGGVIYSYEENLLLFLLLNPIMYLVEFFVRIMAGQSLVNDIPTVSGITQTRGPINLVAVGNRWMILSTILFLAVSFLFLWLAAKRIDPIKRKAKKQAMRRAAQGAQVSGTATEQGAWTSEVAAEQLAQGTQASGTVTAQTVQGTGQAKDE